MKAKRWIYRIAAILILVAIGAVMFVIGRGHTVYFDNKKMDYNGTTLEPPRKVEVYVDGERVAKLSPKDRGMATNIGQHFEMTLEITKNKGDDPVTQEVSLELPFNMDGVIVNIPGLLADIPYEDYISEFVQTDPEPTEEDEEVVTDEFAMDAEF